MALWISRYSPFPNGSDVHAVRGGAEKMKIAHTLFADEIRMLVRLTVLTGELNDPSPLARYRDAVTGLGLTSDKIEKYRLGGEACMWLALATQAGRFDYDKADSLLESLASELKIKVGTLYRLAIAGRESALAGRSVDISALVNPPNPNGYTVKEIAVIFGVTPVRARAIAKSSQWPNLNIDDHLAIYPKELVMIESKRRGASRQVSGYKK